MHHISCPCSGERKSLILERNHLFFFFQTVLSLFISSISRPDIKSFSKSYYYKVKMFTKLLLLCTAAAVTAQNNINFIYATSSYDDIQNAGSGYSSGFTLKDTSGNTIYSNSDPWGYAPCQDSSEKFTLTSDCWSGTWTFGCEADFSGAPKLCAAYAPDGTSYSGTADSTLDFIGISAGESGYCGGNIDVGSDTCSSSSTYTVTSHYTGDYKST